MLRVISVNVNGIRAAAKKGLFEWLLTQQADVICVQETKAQESQLNDDAYRLPGYYRYFHDAQKRGYSGVALYSKTEPLKITRGFGMPLADGEGRYIQADYEGIRIASVYLPSGTSGEARQQVKYEVLDHFSNFLDSTKADQREYIVCGDFNIAHHPIDLKNWRSNQKNSGFLPQERAWLDKLFDQQDYVDAFRVVNQEPEQYTWWSSRGQAWANNVGWRIDYHIVTPGLKQRILDASIYKGQQFSDHAPLTIDYDISILKL